MPELLALALVVILPAFVNLGTLRIFEAEKALLLRAGAGLILAVMLFDFRRHARDVAWRHPVVLAVGALLLALTAAALLGVAPSEAVRGAYARQHGLLTWVALAIVFVAICAAARREQGRQRIAAALVIGSLAPALYAVAQIGGLDPVEWGDTVPGRAGSTFGNPVLLGGYLAAVAPITVILAVRRRVYVVALALQVAGVAASGSRGALIGLLAGAAVFAFVSARAASRVRLAAAVVTLMAAVALSGSVLQPAIVDRLDGLATSGSGRVRLLIWSGIADLMRDRPERLVLGFGPESLRRVFPPYYRGEIGRIERGDVMPDRAHNEPLDRLVDAGLVGIVLQLVLYAVALVAALRIPDPLARSGLAAALTVHIVETQTGISTVASRLVFLTCAALAAGFGTALPRDTPLRRAAVRRNLSWRAVAGLMAGAAAAVPLYLVPSRADALAKRASAHEAREQWPAAASTYAEALRLQPHVERYLTGLARAYAEAGATALTGAQRERHFAAAQAALASAASHNPHDVDHPRNLARLHRTWAAFLGGAARAEHLRAADRHYDRATRIAPAVASLWVEWARVDGDRNQPERAAQKIDRALALNPDDGAAWTLRGHLLAMRGDLAGSLAAYDRSVSLTQDEEARRAREIVRARLSTVTN